MNDLRSKITGIVLTTIIAAIGAILILNYKNLLFWQKLDNSFDIENNFDQFEPKDSTGSLRLYKDFVMTEPVSAESIRNISYRIRAKGKLAAINLHAEAEPSKFGTDTTRIHTIYFYIDSGITGGHLEARRKNAQIIEGGFKIGSPKYILNINADKLVVARGSDELKEIYFLDTLNDNQSHWVGAFVATGIYGILKDMTLEFTCAKETPDCSIDIE